MLRPGDMTLDRDTALALFEEVQRLQDADRPLKELARALRALLAAADG